MWTVDKDVNMKVILAVMNTNWAEKFQIIHIYDFHTFTVISSLLHGFIWNQHNEQLPVGLLA